MPSSLNQRKRSERIYRHCDIRKDTVNVEARSVDVSFSSETDEITFFGTPELLLHEKGSLDLRKLKTLGSVLFNHNPDVIVGRPEDVHLDESERKGRATIVFDADPESERIFQKVQNGSLRGVSVGFRVQKWQILNDGEEWKSPEGRTFRGPMDIATKWRPAEFSLTPVPADGAVGVNRSTEKGQTMPNKLRTLLQERHGLAADATDEDVLALAAEKLSSEERSDPPEDPKPESETPAPAERRSEEDAVRAERERVRDIRSLCAIHPSIKDLELRFVDEGYPIDKARKEALEVLKEKNPATSSPRRIEIEAEERDKLREAAVDHLLLRVNKLRGGQKLEERTVAARQIPCYTLFDLARWCVERANIRIGGMGRDEIIIRALTHSSSDYPSILENTARKSLLLHWSEAPSTWEAVARRVTAVDFKTMSRPKLGDSGDLELTPEMAPMAEGSIPESKETYSIATYSKRFGIGRQAIINDDLSAFDQIPALHGAAARRLPNKLLYDLLISASGVGPTMAEDSVALFATTHTSGANYTASTGAPDVAGLAVGMKLMRLQKGMAATGETAPILNLTPAILLVPAALEVQARQTIASIVDPSQNNAAANPFANALQVVVEARLDAATNGSTAWYLISLAIAGAEVAFLNGQSEPNFVRVEGTNALGVEFGVYLDCGVKFVEHRGWYRTKGA